MFQELPSYIDPNTAKGSWGVLILVIGVVIAAAFALRILKPIRSTPLPIQNDSQRDSVSATTSASEGA